MKSASNLHQNTEQQLTIGLLDENGNDEYHGILMEGVFASAEKHQARVIRIGHFTTNETKIDPMQVKMIHEVVHQFNFDGLMYLGWIRATSYVNEQTFHHEFADIPLFSIGIPYPGIPSAVYNSDPYILELLLHLLDDHQYKQIAFIAPFWADSRVEVYFKTMRERNLLNTDLYIDEQLLQGLTVPERGRRAVEILLDERKVMPDAIMSLYNAETEGILKELNNRGLKVPENIAVTSYEDGEVGRYGSPPYTTVMFPWYELGRTSCDLFLTQLENSRASDPCDFDFPSSSPDKAAETTTSSVQVPGFVILRESCGCKSEFGRTPTKSVPLFKAITDMEEAEWHELSIDIEKAYHSSHSLQPDICLLMNSIYQGIRKSDWNLLSYEVKRQLHLFELSKESDKQDPLLDFLKNSLLPHIIECPEVLPLFHDMFMQANALVSVHSLKTWGEMKEN